MAHNDHTGTLRHVVMFRFKDTTSPEMIARIETAFRALPGKIPQVKGFEWGTDMSDGSRAHGYSHCFLLTFESKADLGAYQEHPAHKDFVNLLLPGLDAILVLDYWAAA